MHIATVILIGLGGLAIGFILGYDSAEGYFIRKIKRQGFFLYATNPPRKRIVGHVEQEVTESRWEKLI